MQDEIAYRVLADIHVKLGRGEAISHFLRATNNFAVFDAYMRAVAKLHKFEKEASFKERELCLKDIKLDPKYAAAMAYLGFVYIQQARRGWVPDPEKARRLAADWAQRAFELDPNNAVGLRLLSRLQSEKGNHQEAIALGKRSVELNPSDAIAYSTLAFTYLLARQPEPALQAINQTLRLAPHSPPLYHWFAGVANDWNGRHETAVSEFKKVVAKANGGIFLRAGLEGLILSYMKMGEEDQAKAAAEKLINAYPGYTISGYVRRLKIFTFKDFNWLEENVEILRKMGLPE